MFWRLFLTYLFFVIISVGLVVLIEVRRLGGETLLLESAREVLVTTSLVVVLSLPFAYILARRFTRPLAELARGARQIADGDLSHVIQTTGSREFKDLAEAFNAMSVRLSASFTQVEHDHEQLRTVLSGMVEGVVAFENDQRILFINDRATFLLDIPPGLQTVGRKIGDVIKNILISDAVVKGLNSTGPYREEVDCSGPNERVLAVYVTRLPGADANGAVMVLNDITDLRRLERLRQDFVANVSHELKTPLANIKSSVEVLLDGAVEDESIRDGFLWEIDQQSNRLDALVADLISLARIESGAAILDFVAILIDDAVHACLDRHRTRAEAKRLSLNGVALAGCPSSLSVWADDEALAQILDNLVDNAIKYTPEGGRVTVRWKMTEQQVIIDVEDTGTGIPDRDLPRVFERFYRVDKARSREMGGTGLGLAIVKHMAQTMGGSVGVISELNKGTTFSVTLPRAADSRS